MNLLDIALGEASGLMKGTLRCSISRLGGANEVMRGGFGK